MSRLLVTAVAAMLLAAMPSQVEQHGARASEASAAVRARTARAEAAEQKLQQEQARTATLYGANLDALSSAELTALAGIYEDGMRRIKGLQVGIFLIQVPFSLVAAVCQHCCVQALLVMQGHRYQGLSVCLHTSACARYHNCACCAVHSQPTHERAVQSFFPVAARLTSLTHLHWSCNCAGCSRSSAAAAAAAATGS